MVRIIFGLIILIFGLMGFAVETDAYFKTGYWDFFGLFVSAVLVSFGGLLSYSGIISKGKEKYKQKRHRWKK